MTLSLFLQGKSIYRIRFIFYFMSQGAIVIETWFSKIDLFFRGVGGSYKSL